MIIDCDQCAMQYTSACDDCIVTALLDGPRRSVELDGTEAAAIDHLATAGLIAPLRLVPRTHDPEEAAG